MKIKSTLLLLLTAAIWGFAFVAQSLGSEFLGPFAFNGIRFALGGLSLIPVILIFERKKETKKTLIKTLYVSIAAGVILFAASALQQTGIIFTADPGKSAFITTLYTVLVPIIGFLFMKRKTGGITWTGVIIAVVGLFFLSFFGNGAGDASTATCYLKELTIAHGLSAFVPLIGDFILIIGAIFWALHIIIIDRYVNEIPALKFACLQFLVCSACGMLMSLTESYTWADVKLAGIPILYCGLCSVGIAYTCQILGQKEADPTIAAIICSSESVFSAIGSALIMGKYMSPIGYFGCALIFIGMIFSQLDGTKFLEGIKLKLGFTGTREKQG